MRAGDVVSTDTDPAYEGADSYEFCPIFMQLVRNEGFELFWTVIAPFAAQAPKFFLITML